MRARIFIGVVISIFGISCQLNKNTIYKMNDDSFYFDSDSTFTYFSDKPGYVKRHSSGKLVRNGSEINLSSYVIDNRFPVSSNVYKSINRKNEIAVNIHLITKENPDNDYSWRAFSRSGKKLYDPGEICLDSLMRSKIDISEYGSKLYKVQGSRVFYITEPIDSLFFTIWKSPFESVCRDWGDYPVNTIPIKINCVLGDSINVNINIIDSLFSYQIFKDVALKKKYGYITLKYNNGFKYRLYRKRYPDNIKVDKK